MTAETAATLSTALLLAAAGWRCFPCASNKQPATPHGFKDAADDPATLHALWYQYPAPLIGVATGAASGRDVLDLDRKHPEAHQWWAEHRAYLPRTRTHRTRSGGLHLILRHQPGVGIWAGRPVPGVDGRGDRGFAIWWPAAGLRVLSDAPPAPWPEWLLDELSPPGPAAPSAVWTSSSDASRYRTGSRYTSAAQQNAVERVAGAPIGSRNHGLNRESYGIGRLVAEGLLDAQEVADTLAAAAVAAGLSQREIEATLRSAFGARGLL